LIVLKKGQNIKNNSNGLLVMQTNMLVLTMVVYNHSSETGLGTYGGEHVCNVEH